MFSLMKSFEVGETFWLLRTDKVACASKHGSVCLFLSRLQSMLDGKCINQDSQVYELKPSEFKVVLVRYQLFRQGNCGK